jgi:hypothetical protein
MDGQEHHIPILTLKPMSRLRPAEKHWAENRSFPRPILTVRMGYGFFGGVLGGGGVARIGAGGGGRTKACVGVGFKPPLRILPSVSG